VTWIVAFDADEPALTTEFPESPSVLADQVSSSRHDHF
jgi:hypothetical protein